MAVLECLKELQRSQEGVSVFLKEFFSWNLLFLFSCEVDSMKMVRGWFVWTNFLPLSLLANGQLWYLTKGICQPSSCWVDFLQEHPRNGSKTSPRPSCWAFSDGGEKKQHLESLEGIYTWNLKQPLKKVVVSIWMIPNPYFKKWLEITKDPFKKMVVWSSR